VYTAQSAIRALWFSSDEYSLEDIELEANPPNYGFPAGMSLEPKPFHRRIATEMLKEN
jgi:hypothetical protein